MSQILYIENDNAVVLKGLQDIDGNYISTAVVTLESLVDRSGVAVTGISPPVSMPYVTGSNGDYRTVLPHTVGIALGRHYTAKVKAVSGTVDGTWYEILACRRRTSN